jgi:hypothetical protein
MFASSNGISKAYKFYRTYAASSLRITSPMKRVAASRNNVHTGRVRTNKEHVLIVCIKRKRPDSLTR